MTTMYFDNLHEEALTLLIEARNYIRDLRSRKEDATDARPPLENTDFLDQTLETMRLTSRLTQVMAWLLAQRAVSAGEITAKEGASKRFKLSGQSVCLDHNPAENDHLPQELRSLLQRSHTLYLRVSRLDEQISGRLGAVPLAQIADGTERPPNVLPLIPVTASGQDPQNAY